MSELAIMETSAVMLGIESERTRQDDKWGEQNHDDLSWLAILLEEVGEAAKDVVKSSVDNGEKSGKREILDNLERELVQVAAVAVAWLECIRRREDTGKGIKNV